MNEIRTLTIEQVRALPNFGPRRISDTSEEIVPYSGPAALDLMAAAPALRATALDLAAENERLKLAAADAGKEADDFADEGLELCRLLGIDTSGDYDLVEAVAALVEQVAQLNAALTAAGYLPGLSGVQALLADLGEARRELAASAPPPNGDGSAEQGWLTPAAFTIPEGSDCDESEGTGYGLAVVHDEDDARKAWAPAAVQQLVRRLSDDLRAIDEKATSLMVERDLRIEKASAPSPTPIRLEWSHGAEQSDLDVVAGEFRFKVATITIKAPVTAEIFRYSNGRASETIARDIPDAVNIITALLALRGITVPPFPEQT